MSNCSDPLTPEQLEEHADGLDAWESLSEDKLCHDAVCQCFYCGAVKGLRSAALQLRTLQQENEDLKKQLDARGPSVAIPLTGSTASENGRYVTDDYR